MGEVLWRNWLDRRGVHPGFLVKSGEDVGGMGDRCDTENERVRKQLKRKRTERVLGKKKSVEMSARRHFWVGGTPLFLRM